MRDVLQRAVNRLVYGERDEPWRAMRRLAQRLEFAAEPDRAFPAIVDTVADALRLPYVGLEVIDEEGRMVEVAVRGDRQAEVVTVPIAHGAEPVGRLSSGCARESTGSVATSWRCSRTLGDRRAPRSGRCGCATTWSSRASDWSLAREEERRRLRRDLHDGLGPTLAAIGMRAEASSAVVATDPEAAQRQLDALGEEVREALADVRRLVDGLRPPALDELGLAGAIGQQAARLDRQDGGAPSSATRVVVEPSELPELPAAVEVAAYRIAVEAMTNAVRHAGASACRIVLHADSQLTIEVTDDGRGLPGHAPAGHRPRVDAGARGRGRRRGRGRTPARGRHARARAAAAGPGGAAVSQASERIRVLVADDHAAFRAGLVALLGTADDIDAGRARRRAATRPWPPSRRATPTWC